MPASTIAQSEWSIPPPGAAPTTTAEQSKLRKKIQNRIHKRNSRLRRGMTNPSSQLPRSRPYRVHRYRLDEQLVEHSSKPQSPGLENESHPVHNKGLRELSRPDRLAHLSTEIWFPLPADDLHRTIKYNVFRGLHKNKEILSCHTVQVDTPFTKSAAFASGATFPSYSVLLPASSHDCGYLSPTQAQMDICHSSWIDIIPCPTLRENLMRREFEFSHVDFVKDLVGTAINLNIFTTFSTSSSVIPGDEQLHNSFSSVEETGLIIWGEPYLVESWEVTPHFLRKWAWALEGCGQLIDSTNRWRTSRGETTLRLPSTSIMN